MEEFLQSLPSSKAMTKEISIELKLDTKSLICVSAQIDLTSKNELKTHLRDLQLVKSRSILVFHPELLVCPDPSFLEEILIVAPQNVVQRGLLRTYLEESQLILRSEKLEVSFDILKACLLFTVAARLAPEWNSLGRRSSENGESIVLIHGKNFLSDASKSPAVAVNLRVYNNGRSVWIGFRLGQLRLPVMRPEYLSINPYYIEKILARPGRQILEDKIKEPWAYALPSLEKCRITTLSNGLPLEADYTDYCDIRRYWEETNGYVLPLDDVGAAMLFASVKLEDGAFSHVFPLHCLLRTPPLYSKLECRNSPVRKFIRDIQSVVAINKIIANGQEYVAKEAAREPRDDEDPMDDSESVASAAEISVRSLGKLAANRKRNVAADTQRLQFDRRRLSLTKSTPREERVLYPREEHRPASQGVPQTATGEQRPESSGEPRTTIEQQRAASEDVPQTSQNTRTPGSAVSKNTKAQKDIAEASRSSPRLAGKIRKSFSQNHRVLVAPSKMKEARRPALASNPLDVLIETRFKKGTLEKATVSQLYNWLREREIPRRSNRDKEFLVSLVRAELTKTAAKN